MLKNLEFPLWERETPIFVEAKWLHQNLDNPRIKILDGTWALPGTHGLVKGVIPKAQFFNLGSLKEKTELGAAYPPVSTLQQMSAELGIDVDDHIIVYDRQGFFSAPRVAWSFLSIGHKAVSVLRGGLPEWIANGYKATDSHATGNYNSNYQTSASRVKGVTIGDVLAAIDSPIQIIDARSEGRFYGREAEPRSGLRSGHIPSSINLPLAKLKSKDGRLITGEALTGVLNESQINLDRPIITSCGSGVTAAALAFIFYALGKQDIAVYSGSWAEYGASEYPIETSGRQT
jgi:thiosulfate/3-mercaptopyruvate sulfurtransferase